MGNKELELLELFLTDSQQAVCQLIDLYGGSVTAICRQILRNCSGSLVDDAVQETFVRLWQVLSKGKKPKTSLKAYVYQTARNCAISQMREFQKKNDVSLEQLQYTGIEQLVSEDCNTTEKKADVAHSFRVVHQVIDEMGEPDRSIFVLRFFYNYTVREISNKLNLKEDKVESRIRRNRGRLKEKLEKRGVFYE